MRKWHSELDAQHKNLEQQKKRLQRIEEQLQNQQAQLQMKQEQQEREWQRVQDGTKELLKLAAGLCADGFKVGYDLSESKEVEEDDGLPYYEDETMLDSESDAEAEAVSVAAEAEDRRRETVSKKFVCF